MGNGVNKDLELECRIEVSHRGYALNILSKLQKFYKKGFLKIDIYDLSSETFVSLT